jgi:TonB family protein
MKTHPILLGLFAAAFSLPLSASEADSQAESLAKPAKLSTSIAPDYPEDLRREFVTGTVTFELLIDDQGVVVVADVVSVSDSRLIPSARAAVLAWTFEPATNAEGDPIFSVVRVPLRFQLTPAGDPASWPAVAAR